MKTKIFLPLVFAAIILIAGTFKLTYNKSVITHSKKNNVLSYRINDSYDSLWAKVDSLANKGLTKSALELVKVIYDKAKRENNSPHFVKSVIYKLKLSESLEEDAMEKGIAAVTTDVNIASGVTKPILHSMLAELYWQYFRNNRYKFYNRTEVVDSEDDDIQTWDLKKIMKKIIYHFSQSLADIDLLKNTKLELYDAVLIKDSSSRNYRPTLYDFLAHRAVDFFMHDESNLTKPVYAFEADTAIYLASTDVFSDFKIKTRDTLSLTYHALQLLQDLEKFHSKDADPKALIDVVLKRLNFVRNKAVFENTDSLYLQSLLLLEAKYVVFPASADISYEIADEYYKKGLLFEPLKSTDNKWMIQKAYEKCAKTIAKYPNSHGAVNCNYLKNLILQKILSFQTEESNSPNKPFRALVKYRNLDNISIRIIKTTFEENKKLTDKYSSNDLIKAYLKLPLVKEWQLALPQEGDYQEHSVEIKMPALPLGMYIAIMTNGSDFSDTMQIKAYGDFWITNISYIDRDKGEGVKQFCLMNRETGKPLQGVVAQAYQNKYNFITRSYEPAKWKSFVSNNEGFIEVSDAKEYRYFYFDFKYGADRFVSRSNFYLYKYYDSEKKPYTKTFFFSDRSIYRPGQTIYFKGLIMECNGNRNYKIKPNTETTVYLYDANHQKAAELELTSNDYGTFSGTFTAPDNLNGQIYITNNSGYLYLSVEEYKRPKFSVQFEPVKGSYKLDEKVTLAAVAKAYAGNVIDNAMVKYRVVRNANFPYWYWWRGYMPASAQIQITSGETKTDKNGAFSVDFLALPDLKVRKYDPVFSFTVYADVTDINGETHTAQKTITIGYKALIMNLTIPEKVNKNNQKGFVFSATNLNGEKEPAKGTIRVFQLKQPAKPFRKRLWEQPDQYIITKEEYQKDFPFDIYADENNMYKWEKENKVWEYTFETPRDSLVIFNKIKEWKTGAYVVEIDSKDKYGADVAVRKYFTLFDNAGKKIPDNSVFWAHMLDETAVPGEKITFLAGTKEDSLTFLYEIEYDGRIIQKQWLTLKNEQRLFEVPVNEAYKGGFSIHLMTVKNNRNYVFSKNIEVPYSDKVLSIEYETFRDKLQPGENEQWKIKIKGNRGEKLTAELLAAMYDASLDAFKSNIWSYNIYNKIYSSLDWDAYNSFLANTSGTVNVLYSYTYPEIREYDRLNWFGFNYMNYYNGFSGEYSDYGGAMMVSEISGVAVGNAGRGDGKGRKNERASYGLISKDKAGDTFEVIDDSVLSNRETVEEEDVADFSNVSVRSDFSETAFFYPQLLTDEEGSLVISFTVPEALTKWKIMTLAHTKDLKFGYLQKELLTQKELMVVTNAPRFLRETDKISLSAKVSNISGKDIEGQAMLYLYDAQTLKAIDTLCSNLTSVQTFLCKAGQSSELSWDLTVPEYISAIKYKVVAKSNSFSDGEENTIPVLSNRMLITESMPLSLTGEESKKFEFTKLLNSASSGTLKNHKLTLEFCANPVWYAVQALPYLMEFPYECSEQLFSRYYANSIASHIANANPRIKNVFDAWEKLTPNALLSNLEKNQELKSLILAETPWVLQAQSEKERKQRISLLFEISKMAREQKKALAKLEKMQLPNGGFPWFGGTVDDRYITQYIVTGFGHLDNLGIKDIRNDSKCRNIVKNAVQYIDDRIVEDYEWLKKNYAKEELVKNHTSYTQIQYLYARSYFVSDFEMNAKTEEAYNYFMGQVKTYWNSYNRYMQGMTALALNRSGSKSVSLDILKSLKENAIISEELGMYWKDMSSGYYWYQAPVETQSLLMEAFDKVVNDSVSVEKMKIWLLKNKQTNDWKTTKATSEAIYALLLRGAAWIDNDVSVQISMGKTLIEPLKDNEIKQEAGSGYFKTSWNGSEILPEMGNITVKRNNSPGISWGAVYWQYFEQLDKITSSSNPLQIQKKLFIQRDSETGPVIEQAKENTGLKVGDKIIVRIEISVDRNMEYVHLKDMRASGLEPVNVFSSYKYQDGLGYYESTGDAATNFFFSYLPKGTHIFEYPLLVTHKGVFSNGVASIQCMYAPEFISHSEGVTVKVE